MNFLELADLQRDIGTLLEHQIVALKHYYVPSSGGFRHRFDESSDAINYTGFSKASTATCVLSLLATARWKEGPWQEKAQDLCKAMLCPSNWSSAGLKEGNPFTVSFMLEVVGSMVDEGCASLDSVDSDNMKKGELILYEALFPQDAAIDGVGAVRLEQYPPSAYLTQLVVRVLDKHKHLDERARNAARTWAWREIEHELALRFSGSQTADAFNLAYSVMVVALCCKRSDATLDENQILRKAIDTVFEAQLPDGSWPLSTPLFHYPEVGNAHCFEYEMLTQLLRLREFGELTERVLDHIPQLALATRRLRETAFHFEDGGLGWASGHHPHLLGPESWSTASVYHFLYELDRTLAEAVRRSVFEYIGAEYIAPNELHKESDFANQFLDSELKLGDKTTSLRNVIYNRLALPVREQQALIQQGRDLPSWIPVSAIFFGPPGTAKTQLAKHIAGFVGWPLLTIDPSHLVRRGLDQVQAETNMVFSMLASLECVVVLLDEFDEMVRERTAQQSEVVSRFLTTAMLPKLAQIYNRRRIIFIVATNHIEQFDFAILRPGRFDMILQIMPPSTEEKLRKWNDVSERFLELKIDIDKEVETRKKISHMTYAEFQQLIIKLKPAENEHHARMIIDVASSSSTLMQPMADKEGSTWASVCEEQERYIRIPYHEGDS